MFAFDLQSLSPRSIQDDSPGVVAPLSAGLDFTTLFDQLIAIVFGLGYAAVILAVGWTIAKVVRSIIVRALRRTPLDRHLSHFLTGGRKSSLGLENTLGQCVYALLMLFVAVEVLRALGLTQVAEPLSGLVSSVVDFLPRLLAAGALAALAWGLATVARMLALNLIGPLQLGERLGEATGDFDAEPATLTRTLGDVVFYFTLLFFTPQVLDALQMQGLSPVQDMVGNILAFVPSFLGAAFVFTLFFFVAKIVRRFVLLSLSSLGFDQVPEKLGLAGAAGPSASVAASWTAFVALLFLGAVQAANTLGLSLLAELAQALLMGLFRILISVLILAVGLWAGRMIEATLAAWRSENEGALPLARYAKFAVVALAGAMALGQTGLAPEILNITFGAVALGGAIAGGLAFGFGGRESAAKWLENRLGSH